MAAEVFNRREIKYMISEELYHRIRPVLEEFMEIDAHSRKEDYYQICNIYYDTPDHQIIRSSIEKPVYKEKLRLRSYGIVGRRDKVYLEIKKKFNGLVNKRRTSMSLEEAENYILTGCKPELRTGRNSQILSEIDYLIHRYPVQPMLYLSYDRNAFYGKENLSFRVTFDTKIRARRYDLSLEKGIYGNELLPEGTWIMEAKSDKALPLWFAKLLSEQQLYPVSFSKYGTEYKQTILNSRSFT